MGRRLRRTVSRSTEVCRHRICVGTSRTRTAAIGDIWVSDPPATPSLTLNRPRGALFLAPIGDGRHRLAVIDRSTMFHTAHEELTFDELRSSTTRIAGTDFGMHDPGYLTRVGNAVLQAESYRRGRVLLAGDAAHIHVPLGGQGMNLGLADASNLGWKLAAEIAGTGSPQLLDSYHVERHPMGECVVEDTRAQSALVFDDTPDGGALRARFNEMPGSYPSLNLELAERLAGLSLSYPVSNASHPLVGHRMPDLAL